MMCDIHTHEYFCKWNSETANIFMVKGEMPHKPPISFFQKKDANLMATANRPSPLCAQRRCRWCPVMSAVASQLFLHGKRRHKSSHYPRRGGRSSTALTTGTAGRRRCCLAMFFYWSRIGCPRENSGSSRS